jgi:hypothetical protein
MQRLHVGDLAGHLLAQRGWDHLNLPAIAAKEERIEIGPGRYHTRKVGDLLHSERESQATLDDIKASMGSAAFSAQYQQSPVPPGGNMIKWEWFKWYDPSDLTVDDIVISWDTAMKATELSDYSVGLRRARRFSSSDPTLPAHRWPKRARLCQRLRLYLRREPLEECVKSGSLLNGGRNVA